MRKEVRIGAVIGGILVATLIVIAVVTSTGKKPAAVVLDKPANPAGTALGGVVVSPTAAGPATPGHDDAVSTPPHDATTDTPAATPGATPGVTPGDAASTPTPGASGSTPIVGGDQTPPAVAETASGKSSADWTKLLSQEKVEADYEPIHSTTPEPAAPSETPSTPGTDSTPIDVSAADPHATPTQVADSSAGRDSEKSGSGITPTVLPPATDDRPAPPPAAGATTHKIASGETFSSISRAVYGDAKYFKEIIKANPTVDPNHLKLGTVIALPDPAQFKHDAKPAEKVAKRPTTPATAPVVNPKTEYRVQSTDSLYKISIKLYKTPNKVDAIYQLNKETIGTDPAKLKLNMVLKLPEPPVETASR